MASIFTKIINRELPADIVYEDDHVIAIRDIEPEAPTHVLIITKTEIPGLAELPNDGDNRHILNTAKIVAEQEGLTSYRLVINQGVDAGQSVSHLHAHLLGGRSFTWAPG